MEMRAILIIALIFFCSCKRDRSKYENATTEECTSVNYPSNEITIIGSPDTSVLISTPPISPQQLQSKIVSLPASIPSIILRRKAYTTSYNSETHNPNWVAWHLTAEHVDGEIPRLRYFIEDEQVPTPRATNEDYKGSGWSRGHMCPAGDNKWDEVAMRESNLLTNICPQHSSLNSGLWNVIERDCRKWAKRYENLYIVCGPVYLNRKHETIGSNKVVVPEAFYKVILRLTPEPAAIGFVVRNNEGKKKKDQFVNTVDDVERITGFDFFSALPDDIENRVESQADINDWK